MLLFSSLVTTPTAKWRSMRLESWLGSLGRVAKESPGGAVRRTSAKKDQRRPRFGMRKLAVHSRPRLNLHKYQGWPVSSLDPLLLTLSFRATASSNLEMRYVAWEGILADACSHSFLTPLLALCARLPRSTSSSFTTIPFGTFLTLNQLDCPSRFAQTVDTTHQIGILSSLMVVSQKVAGSLKSQSMAPSLSAGLRTNSTLACVKREANFGRVRHCSADLWKGNRELTNANHLTLYRMKPVETLIHGF